MKSKIDRIIDLINSNSIISDRESLELRLDKLKETAEYIKNNCDKVYGYQINGNKITLRLR